MLLPGPSSMLPTKREGTGLRKLPHNKICRKQWYWKSWTQRIILPIKFKFIFLKLYISLSYVYILRCCRQKLFQSTKKHVLCFPLPRNIVKFQFFTFFTKWVKMTKKEIYFGYIHPGEVYITFLCCPWNVIENVLCYVINRIRNTVCYFYIFVIRENEILISVISQFRSFCKIPVNFKSSTVFVVLFDFTQVISIFFKIKINFFKIIVYFLFFLTLFFLLLHYLNVASFFSIMKFINKLNLCLACIKSEIQGKETFDQLKRKFTPIFIIAFLVITVVAITIISEGISNNNETVAYQLTSSDMILLEKSSSSFWCKGQSVMASNSKINVYKIDKDIDTYRCPVNNTKSKRCPSKNVLDLNLKNCSKSSPVSIDKKIEKNSFVYISILNNDVKPINITVDIVLHRLVMNLPAVSRNITNVNETVVKTKCLISESTVAEVYFLTVVPVMVLLSLSFFVAQMKNGDKNKDLLIPLLPK
ncbi:hypothetical protein GQR58_020988 [Nymphon striatum]|nr:hypothetical protein GQR58_020988 [Nymphon striatum]